VGEDKPSPLLWTDALGRRIRKHSRGGGLSSPWFLSSTLSPCSLQKSYSHPSFRFFITSLE
ncbi:MAG TPA: hypothetical protein VK140_17165, partial [Ktedonobacteraceae bacterium]|nr:hypothetical protein [Ktedonobacteraceae bacterium]